MTMKQEDKLAQRFKNYKCDGQLSFDDIDWGWTQNIKNESESAEKSAIMEEEPELVY